MSYETAGGKQQEIKRGRDTVHRTGRRRRRSQLTVKGADGGDPLADCERSHMEQKNVSRTGIFLGLAALICMLTANPAYAEEAVTGYDGGPGVMYDAAGNIVEKDDPSVVIAEADAEGAKLSDRPHGETFVEETAEGTVYVHDGTRYQKGDSWGEHRLTGYSREANGSRTASGKEASANHTAAASSELPLGTVLIVEGVSGPNASAYNGVYVVEDRGGSAVEDGLLDLFFETEAEALSVTGDGWNTVQVWIAREAE